MAETTKATKVQKTEAEWRALLTPEQFHVMREGGTERAFTGALVNNHEDGIYHCGSCNAPLFTSDKKFDSGSGWPSFWNPVSADAIEALEDNSHGMKRVEVRCATCGAHLGHVFPDGPTPPACVTASTALRWGLRSSNWQEKQLKHLPMQEKPQPADMRLGHLFLGPTNS